MPTEVEGFERVKIGGHRSKISLIKRGNYGEITMKLVWIGSGENFIPFSLFFESSLLIYTMQICLGDS